MLGARAYSLYHTQHRTQKVPLRSALRQRISFTHTHHIHSSQSRIYLGGETPRVHCTIDNRGDALGDDGERVVGGWVVTLQLVPYFETHTHKHPRT